MNKTQEFKENVALHFLFILIQKPTKNIIKLIYYILKATIEIKHKYKLSNLEILEVFKLSLDFINKRIKYEKRNI